MGSGRHRISGMRGLVGILFGLIATPSLAGCPTGLFTAAAGPDTASMLEIGKDGHFRYALSEGALDESAQGIWTCDKDVLRLTTQPTPKPAEFTLDKVTQGGGVPFTLLVTWPDGRGVPLVDFRLDFESGEPVTGYTQQDGWSHDLDGRMPKAVQVAEPFYGTLSPVFPVPAGRNIKVHIVLTPNDMGTAPFKDTPVTQADGKLVLHWREREIPYRRGED